MDATTKEKLLKLSLILIGFISLMVVPLGMIWPGGFIWHGGEGYYYFQMIAGIYATLGVFMIYAAKNPAKHRTFLWFAVVVNIVHAGIMMVQALGDQHEHAHLYGDVPLLFGASVIIWYLMPPKEVTA